MVEKHNTLITINYFEVCAREIGYEGGGQMRKVWWRQEATEKNFRPPWNTHGKLKGGGGAVGRWACIRTTNGRESKSEWVIVMLGQRRATPRWANDLVWQSEIMGRRQGTPGWADEPVWSIWQGLGNLEGIGSIHNNNQQSLGFEQSLAEAWKNQLIIWSPCLPPETSYHTHTHTHNKLLYLFLYFGIFHSEFIIMLVLCLLLSK